MDQHKDSFNSINLNEVEEFVPTFKTGMLNPAFYKQEPFAQSFMEMQNTATLVGGHHSVYVMNQI